MISCRGNDALRRDFPARDPRSGFTLMELLTVMAIIALIGGLGAGAYQVARRNYSITATAGRIQGVLRAARNASVSTGVPSFVVADPMDRTVSAYSYERVGEWSFDLPQDDPIVQMGLGRYSSYGARAVPGKIGSGIGLGGGAYVDCGNEARFDLRTTIHIEAWIRQGAPDLVAPPRSQENMRRLRGRSRPVVKVAKPAAAIVEKLGAYFLGVTDEGELEGAVGEYRLRTDSGVVRPGRWVHVAMRFDGTTLELAADGVPRFAVGVSDGISTLQDGAGQLPTVAPVTPAPLTFSSEGRPYRGEIDEVKLSGGVEPLVYQYSDVEKILGWKKVIHFDRLGHLDARFHKHGARLVLVELEDDDFDTTSKTAVVVDYSVTFEEWLAQWDTPPPMRQIDEEAKLEAYYASRRKVVIEVDRLGVVH